MCTHKHGNDSTNLLIYNGMYVSVTDVVKVAATDGDSSLNDYNVIQYSIKGKKLLRRILQIYLFIHCKTLTIHIIKIWQFSKTGVLA